MSSNWDEVEYQNPLLSPILALLRQDTQVHKLHELMQRLADQGCLPDWGATAEIQLFRTNFLLMNALYQLQLRLLDCDIWLNVVPLALRLEPLQHSNSGVLPRDPLRDYYLDWANCFATSQQDVEALLQEFWQRYRSQPVLSLQIRHQALRTLGLCEHASYAVIRQRWKQLAFQHHPDRQGDGLQFMAIRLAWEQLRSCYEHGVELDQ